jgi:hypothetical protein
MNIYNYHPVTGGFLGASEADESPLEPGVFLVPAYATEKEPPAAPEGKQAVWSGEEWTLQDIPVPPPPPPEAVPVTPQQEKNNNARAYLNQTDWYVIRQIETGTPVPEEITAARAKARAEIVE